MCFHSEAKQKERKKNEAKKEKEKTTTLKQNRKKERKRKKIMETDGKMHCLVPFFPSGHHANCYKMLIFNVENAVPLKKCVDVLPLKELAF